MTGGISAAWGEGASAEERDALIDRIARGIVRRRMEVPAILFLEMHRPLSFAASQAMIVLSPFVIALIGVENCRVASGALADRDNVERLIRRIEDLSAAQLSPPVSGVGDGDEAPHAARDRQYEGRDRRRRARDIQRGDRS